VPKLKESSNPRSNKKKTLQTANKQATYVPKEFRQVFDMHWHVEPDDCSYFLYIL
jgi:hypothetical protein